ncbi:YqzG/YhdC family protein [Neobacillus cucumis]|uniref:YqzG/YhdC family protein n=1 Tax=Neobacillus cucumis TaxID=1740721 RepID=UPI002155DD96|nr:YqzG/YhdC family protein [Neobacillus cucumis]
MNIGLLQFPDETAAQQKPVPPYAKWGTMAMEKTKERYPNANIIDYLHIGRVTGPKSTTEKFKLWLKSAQKEFGVFVDIEFNPATNQVINITFRETTR